MASGEEGKDLAQKGNGRMTADYGQRAGIALDRLVAGPHRDKTVARLFGVSVRMAKYLRAGQHWTADRLTQASAMLGAAFDAALYTPVSSATHYSEMAAISERLDRLEARFVEMDRGGDARLAQAAGPLRNGQTRGIAAEPEGHRHADLAELRGAAAHEGGRSVAPAERARRRQMTR